MAAPSATFWRPFHVENAKLKMKDDSKQDGKRLPPAAPAPIDKTQLLECAWIDRDLGWLAFNGRVLFAEQSPAKYVNSPETMLFIKGAVLFGLHKSKRALLDKSRRSCARGRSTSSPFLRPE